MNRDIINTCLYGSPTAIKNALNESIILTDINSKLCSLERFKNLKAGIDQEIEHMDVDKLSMGTKHSIKVISHKIKELEDELISDINKLNRLGLSEEEISKIYKENASIYYLCMKVYSEKMRALEVRRDTFKIERPVE